MKNTRAGERSIGRYLRDLVKRGVLEKRNEHAWSSVRHAVMHGNLVSPWGTQEEDKRLLDLADLVHRLTRELIHEGVKLKEEPFLLRKGTATHDSAGGTGWPRELRRPVVCRLVPKRQTDLTRARYRKTKRLAAIRKKERLSAGRMRSNGPRYQLFRRVPLRPQGEVLPLSASQSPSQSRK